MKTILGFIWKILWFFLKPVLRFVVALAVLYVIGYLIVTQYDWTKHVAPEDVPQPVYTLFEKLDFRNWNVEGPSLSLPSFGNSDVIFAINDDLTSPVGAVVTFNEEDSFVVYMRDSGGARIMDRIVSSDEDGGLTTLTFDDFGMPQTLQALGYTVDYGNISDTAMDVTITDPEGNVETREDIPLDFASKSAMLEGFSPEKAHAVAPSAAVKFLSILVGKKLTAAGIALPDSFAQKVFDYNDVRDHAYWTESVSMSVNIGVCAGGALTMLVPNPLSAGAIALGCGGAILDGIPVFTPFDPCNTKDVYSKTCFWEIVDQVRGMDNSAPVSRVALQGQVLKNESRSPGIESAKIVFTHKDGEAQTSVPTPNNGLFGFTLPANGVALKNGAYTAVLTAPGYKTMNLRGAVSDDGVKFIDNETGETVFNEKRRWSGLGDHMKLYMRTPEEAAEETVEDTTTETTPATTVYEGDISSFAPNSPDSFPFMKEFFGSARIEINDGTATCYWSFEGNLDYTSNTGSIFGDTNVESDSCEGIVQDSAVQLAGKQSGVEPMPTVSGDPSAAIGKLGGQYSDVDFSIVGTTDGDTLSGTLFSTRGVFIHELGGGIQFVLNKK